MFRQKSIAVRWLRRHAGPSGHGMRRYLLFVTQCLYRAQKLHTASRILEIGFIVFLLRCTLQQFVLSNFVSNCPKRDVSTQLVRSDGVGGSSALEATARVSGDVLVQAGMCWCKWGCAFVGLARPSSEICNCSHSRVYNNKVIARIHYWYIGSV